MKATRRWAFCHTPWSSFQEAKIVSHKMIDHRRPFSVIFMILKRFGAKSLTWIGC